ncbi:MAG: LptE family protein [Smithella sp.]|jgi:outer membrane lipopolysaccharide assembly protein LptE/RlpB
MMSKQNWRQILKTLIICLSFVLLFGCGYTFSPQGKYIENRIQRVYVKSFDNKTAQAEVENYFRTAFINQFVQNSRFKIVNNEESADAIVKGTVLNLNRTPLSYLQNGLTAEERATIILEVTFQENDSGKLIWSSKSMSGSVDYAISDDINLLSATRKQALIKLANDTAEKAFNLMMSGF